MKTFVTFFLLTVKFFSISPALSLDTLYISSNDLQDSIIWVTTKGHDPASPKISLSKDSLFLFYSTGWHTRDSFYVRNSGFDSLRVDTLTTSGWLDFFTMIEPGNASIPPGDTTIFYVELMIPVFMTPPVLTDTIFVHSNDPLKPISNLIVKWELPQSAKDDPIPLGYSLEQNYPNPFNSETIIEFSLKESIPVRLELFSPEGKLLKVLIHKQMEPGLHFITVNGQDLPSGALLYRITAGDFTKSKKMILLK